jgi:hypothetical protein
MSVERKARPTTSEPLIAQVLNQNGAIVGVAFAVGQNHILTCAHVVNAALGNRQDPTSKPDLKETVRLVFPFIDRDTTTQARIIDWRAPCDLPNHPEEDLALLEVDKKIDSSKIARFVNSAGDKSLVSAFGYPKESVEGKALRTNVQVMGAVDLAWVQIDGVSGQGAKIEKGFSGSPLSNESGEVVGMVVAAHAHQPDRNIAYMIPAKTLAKFAQTSLSNRFPRYWRSIAPKIFLRSLIQPIVLKPLISGLVGTIFILGIRFLGVLEPVELWVYDRLLANRPQIETQDPRILVVAITEEDLKELHEHQPVSDERILKIMQKINTAQPKVIGLDIIRDRPVNEKEPNTYRELAKFLNQNSSQIVASCKIRDDAFQDDPEYKLPSGFEGNIAGFINLSGDQDNIIPPLQNLLMPKRTDIMGVKTESTLN